MTIEIPAPARAQLTPLFAHYRYDRVLIDSVLEGYFGTAWADSARHPRVARLDSGAFTLFGGDPQTPGTTDLLHWVPIAYVTPQDEQWRDLLWGAFGARLSVLHFTEFSAETLDRAHLASLCATIPAGFDLRKVDRQLASRLGEEMDNEYFRENFHSIEDFIARGMGYCILHQDRIVSAATSMARSSKAIDIEVATLPAFQRHGLGTIVGAALAADCLEQGITPRWLAANAPSEQLALTLGYLRGETYETFAVHPADDPSRS
jgi:GNAT superfamily N-acetyltransferase